MNNEYSSLGKAIKTLMIEEPFYGLLLSSIDKYFTEDVKVDTAGVRFKNKIDTELIINKNYWNNLKNKKYQEGLLMHELLHVALFHLHIRENYNDNYLFNIAADLCINQYIKDDRLKEDWILYSQFSHLPGIQPFKGVDFYYKLLSNNKEDDTISNLLKFQDSNGDMHSTWNISDLDTGAKNLTKSQIEFLIKSIYEDTKEKIKSYGSFPLDLRQIIDNLFTIKPPTVNWKQFIRRFIGTSTKIYTKKSKRKLSKRFEDNPGIKIKKKHKCLVAIDTSGSIKNNELKEFFNEIIHMYKSGISIDIIECDCSIGRIYEFKKIPDTKITGGGGTSFQPIIDYLNNNTNKGYTCAVYFTDGYANIPSKSNVPIMWLISKEGHLNKELQGPVIQMN